MWPVTKCKFTPDPDEKQFRTDVRNALATLAQKASSIMASLTDIQAKVADLTSKVTAETSIETSLVTLLNSMVANNKQLATDLAVAIANSDPAGIQAVADQLDQDTAALAANITTLTTALTANTPAAT